MGLKSHFESKLLAGALAAIPMAVTAFIFWYIDSKVRTITGVHTPFLGVLAALVAIYLLGVFVTSLVGQFLLRLLDWLLNQLPGLRDLYKTWKQIAVTPDGDTGIFARVVLIADGAGRMRMLGFTSGKPVEGSNDTVCVFVPASPNPTTGRLYFVRSSDCQEVNVGTKDALKFVVSGGNYVPAALGAKLAIR